MTRTWILPLSALMVSLQHPAAYSFPRRFACVASDYPLSAELTLPLQIWDVPTVSLRAAVDVNWLPGVTFSHSGHFLIMTPMLFGGLRLWDLRQGSGPASALNLSSESTGCVAFSDDDQWIAAGFGDGFIRVWTHSGRLVAQSSEHMHRVRGIAFTPGGQCLVSGGFDRTIKVWDVTRLSTVVASVAGPADRALAPNTASDVYLVLSRTLTGHTVRCSFRHSVARLF